VRYGDRNATERMFCRLKDFRRIATRYDKLATNFLDAIHLVAVGWLQARTLTNRSMWSSRCVLVCAFMFEVLIFGFAPYVLFSQQPGAPPLALLAPKQQARRVRRTAAPEHAKRRDLWCRPSSRS